MAVNYKKQKGSFDRVLFLTSLLLVFTGLIFVADASSPQALALFGDKLYFFKQQVVWVLIGAFLLFVFSSLSFRLFEKMALIVMVLALVLLAIVLLPGVGTSVYGARRWIDLGPFNLQPSEVFKLALCVYFAKLSAKKKGIFSYFVPLFVALFLIMLEPDLGTAVLVFTIGLGQIFVSGISLLLTSAVLLFSGLASYLLIIVSPYRRARLAAFFDQTADPLGSGYHIRQILLAIGSGGLLGVGFGESRQKYLFLPEAATDSIFAVIAEELGFVGASIIILLFLVYVYRGIKIARQAPDAFAKILATGITLWIGAQAFINIGSMVSLIPFTGIPLPFISYGGSSLLMVLLATGILLNISKHEKAQRRKG